MTMMMMENHNWRRCYQWLRQWLTCLFCCLLKSEQRKTYHEGQHGSSTLNCSFLLVSCLCAGCPTERTSEQVARMLGSTCSYRSVGWFVGWLVGWSVGRSVGLVSFPYWFDVATLSFGRPCSSSLLPQQILFGVHYSSLPDTHSLVCCPYIADSTWSIFKIQYFN